MDKKSAKMDTKLARTIYILKLAAKLKKNNPELSGYLINKNISYFPNESDRKFVNEMSEKEPTVIEEGSSADPAKNIEVKRNRRPQQQSDLQKYNSIELERALRENPPFASLNYEREIAQSSVNNFVNSPVNSPVNNPVNNSETFQQKAIMKPLRVVEGTHSFNYKKNSS
jgi:hypothetical protein